MPISVIRLHRDETGLPAGPGTASRPGGFTLLELLLAMTLMGFLVALILPRLDQLYLSFLFWLDQDRVEREIASLSGRAYLEGKELSLSTWPPPPPRPGDLPPASRSAFGSSFTSSFAAPFGSPPPAAEPAAISEPVRLALPEGWRVVVDPPILFRPDGACSGGTVVIESGEARRRFRLEPPRCRLK